MPIITAFADIGKRQRGGPVQIVADPACYAVCNNAVGVFQSIGFDASELCEVPGQFALAILGVFSCTSKHANDSSNATRVYPYLYTPLSYCESESSFLEKLTAYEATVWASALSSSISSVHSSAENVTSFYCSRAAAGALLPAPYYINCSASGAEMVSTGSTAAAASSLPSSVLSTMISPTTPLIGTSTTTSDSGLSKGAIAGVAVGATIASILVIALVIAFIWWYRRKHKREKAAAQAREPLQDGQEKAQLHSDDYKPHREELHGSKALRVRTIDGLHEVEYQDLSRIRSEMSANEVAAAELDRLGSSRIGTDSTLIDSSERVSGRWQDR